MRLGREKVGEAEDGLVGFRCVRPFGPNGKLPLHKNKQTFLTSYYLSTGPPDPTFLVHQAIPSTPFQACALIFSLLEDSVPTYLELSSATWRHYYLLEFLLDPKVQVQIPR